MHMENKPKSSKHHSNKLPDVFRNGFMKDKEKERKQSERSGVEKEKPQEKIVTKVQKHQSKPSKRQSKNPFLPIQDWLRLSKQMDEKISSVRQGFQSDRLSKLSFEANKNILPKEEKKKQKIKYEDCLTLTIFKKRQESSCVKKILHVPTLTVYYLRESVIDLLSIDKHELEEWIEKCNQQIKKGNSFSQPIVQLYWNTPEGYYSILYEYVDGTFFQTTLNNLYSFPLNFIQYLIGIHLYQEIQIFNSQLIIQRNNSTLSYLPIYEETADLTASYNNFSQLLDLNKKYDEFELLEKKLVARLGFLVLLVYFGEAIIDEDISNIFFKSQSDCCLIHKLLNNETSLVNIYLGVNFQNKIKEKEYLIDFLCKSLRFKVKERSTFSQIKKHKLLSLKVDPEIYSMNELTYLMESAGQSTSVKNIPSQELSLHKLTKILDNMALILQGVQEDMDVNLSPANKNIQYLVRDIGLAVEEGDVQVAKVELVKKLKKIYSQGKSDISK